MAPYFLCQSTTVEWATKCHALTFEKEDKVIGNSSIENDSIKKHFFFKDILGIRPPCYLQWPKAWFQVILVIWSERVRQSPKQKDCQTLMLKAFPGWKWNKNLVLVNFASYILVKHGRHLILLKKISIYPGKSSFSHPQAKLLKPYIFLYHVPP